MEFGGCFVGFVTSCKRDSELKLRAQEWPFNMMAVDGRIPKQQLDSEVALEAGVGGRWWLESAVGQLQVCR